MEVKSAMRAAGAAGAAGAAVVSLGDKSTNGVIDNTSPLWGTMLSLQENLNLRIGTQTWKKYINAAFWNYISTPINFTITLFTAISAGQTGTGNNYLTQNQLFYILFISFILSIINTFFKLKDKAIMNYDSLKKYQDFGAIFERIYFTTIYNEAGLYKRYYAYLDLQTDLNTYESTGSIEHVNYITELIYLSIKCCFENRMKRVNFSQRFWILDGRPKKGYNHNFYVDMKKQYRINFDIESNNETEDVGNKTAKLKRQDGSPPEHYDNDEYDYLGARMMGSHNVDRRVIEEKDDDSVAQTPSDDGIDTRPRSPSLENKPANPRPRSPSLENKPANPRPRSPSPENKPARLYRPELKRKPEYNNHK